MARVKNKSGDAWIDAETNQRVAKGGVIEIPDDRAWGYCQMEDIWAAADKATSALAEEQKAAIEAVDNPPAEVPAEQPVAAENQES